METALTAGALVAIAACVAVAAIRLRRIVQPPQDPETQDDFTLALRASSDRMERMGK